MKRKLKNWFAVFLALIMGLGTLTAQNTVPLNEGFSRMVYHLLGLSLILPVATVILGDSPV